MTAILARISVRTRLLIRATALIVLFEGVAAAASSLLFGSALGGSQSDTIRAIATDVSQNIYVVGETYSTDFPGPANSSAARSAGDAFVVKLNSSGTQILYCVILSGAAFESARAVAVDTAGNAYVTGVTTSSNFPVTAGAVQRFSGSMGLEDAFVVKITPQGAVAYSTYLGGNSSDTGYAIAVDQNGAVYVAGNTGSTNFPVTGAAAQRAFGGASDCFVTKLASGGASLVYSTYLGGAGIDVCKGISVDSSGAAFVTGTTLSTAFPVVNALKTTLSGASDAFLSKLSAAGDRFLFSTYLGGEGADDGNALRLDSVGLVYIGGDTASAGFPVTSGAAQGRLRGEYDGFVCAVANDGSRIVWATYLGGSASDSITDLFVGQDSRIAVAGYTASADFPTVQPLQGTFGGSFDAFVAVLGPGGTSVDFAGYLGAGGDDRAYGVAQLRNGQLIVAGQVLAATVPSIQNRFSFSPAGQYDGFIAAIQYSAQLRFVPVTPCRVADTRNPNGPFGGPIMPGGTSRDFVIPSSACGIPVTAQAYSLNVSVIPAVALSFLTIWPGGQNRPVASLLNSFDGRVKANAAIVPAGVAGAVSVFVTDTSHVFVDINGYFVPATDPSALAFYPIVPCRISDTRDALGILGGPSLVGGQSRTIPVLSAAGCAIPTSARAYALNFTVVPSGPLSFLSTWPTGQARPLVSTLNIPTGTITANAAMVPAGNGGSIDVYVTDNAHLVIDINGYFAPPVPGGLSLYTVAPCRVFDTRFPPPAPAIVGLTDVNITNGTCGIPSVAKAFVLNATVIPTATLGYLSLWPQGQAQPLVSTLNAGDGTLTSNMALVPTTNGSIRLYATDSTHVILDASGFFAP